ncbi:MAG: hypothetical protein IKU30_01770 [Clostridia bacterium]|nr:hypothetical protein [Clostridia bacterium]
MEKRKFKINILDIVIFVVILCSVAILVFRDTVNEIFTKPEITTLEIAVFVNGEENCSAVSALLDKNAVFVPDNKNDFTVNVKVVEFNAASDLHTDAKKGEVKIQLSGYKRLGRFYTEDGTRIHTDTECAIVINNGKINGTLLTVGISG